MTPLSPESPPFTPSISSIAILGAGRLGTSLAQCLLSQHLPLTALWNRRHPSSQLRELPYLIGSIPETLPQTSLLLLTVSDHAITPLAKQLAQEKWVVPGQVVLHCSGLLSSEALLPLQQMGCETGSMHPLQPIASNQKANRLFEGVSVGIEGSPHAQATAQWLATTLGGQTFSLAGVDRSLYHAAAVFASNYAVTLAHVASELFQQSGVKEEPLALLWPLLQQAVQNLRSSGLPHALTGPISRGDTPTLARHRESLQEVAPDLEALYLQLAQATLPIAENQSHHSNLNALKTWLERWSLDR